MAVLQDLSSHAMGICSIGAERLIRILCYDVIILMTDEAHFHLSGFVNKQSSLLAG
jgi:hypothetical protein